LNNKKDIKRIVEDHYIKAGQILEAGGQAGDLTASKRAEDCFAEGLSKLKSLKLSAYDRQNLRLLRKAFEQGVKFTRELQKGNNEKAEIIAEESTDYANRYNAFLISRARMSANV